MSKFNNFDAHIHTKHSACALEEMTVQNIQKRAAENGLKEISLTDHFRINGNIERLKQLRREINKLSLPVKVYLSCEAEITVLQTCSLSQEQAKICDYVSITFSHMDAANRESFMPTDSKSIAGYFLDMFQLAIEVPYAKVIIHPFCTFNSPFGALDKILEHIASSSLNSLLKQVSKNDKILEINPKILETSTYSWMLNFFRQAKQTGCKFCAGSDSHALSDIGRHRYLLESTIKDIGLDENDFWTPQNK